MKKYIFVFLFFISLFIFSPNIRAQESEDIIKGTVIEKIGQQEDIERYKVDLNGEKVEAQFTNVHSRYNIQNGNKVLVTKSGNQYFITDFYRYNYLVTLFVIFAVLSVLIAGIKGFSSLIGLVVSFFIIFSYIIPNINNGHDPVLITVSAAVLIVSVTFYLSHGFTLKTTVSVIGTIISLSLTGLLAMYFINKTHLTGSASEELAFLENINNNKLNISGLLLSGIIIGTLGILDDITISQASVTAEIKKTNPDIDPAHLFMQTMNVGRDHIASLVNTLILVYTGGFLPLLLLISTNPKPFSEVINYEIFAEEIVRTLVSSIGLILAVPITTALATYFATNYKSYIKGAGHEHHH